MSLLYSEKRIIDFDSKKCYVRDNIATLFSPFDFMEGNNLYLPEGVRMPDGRIITTIKYDFDRAFRNDWHGGTISLYAGSNYIQIVDNYNMGGYTEKEMLNYLSLPYLANIYLYDEEINGCTSKNGILYYDNHILFVPERNEYAENAPLQLLTDNYSEEYGTFELIGDDCAKDMFGGIYSRDGKRFLRWSGSWNVTSYIIRDSVEEIGDNAFWVETGYGNGDHGLYSLTDLHLPKGLKKVGNEAFRACPFKEIELPDGIIEIGDYAFASCHSLKTITLPKNLRSLGERVFLASSIETITIPRSVNHIGNECFNACWNLRDIQVEKGNEYFSSDDGILYNADKSVLIKVPSLLRPDTPENVNYWEDTSIQKDEEILCGREGVVEYMDMVEGVTCLTKKDDVTGKSYKEIIHNNACYLSPRISISGWEWWLEEGYRIYVEDKEEVKSDTVLGSYQYYDNPDGLSYLEKNTRRELSVPESVSAIVSYAFYGCQLKVINLPSSITYIGEKAFGSQNLNISPQNRHFKVENDVLIDIDNKKAVYCFSSDSCVVPQGVEIIGKEAFRGTKSKSVVIPEGVTTIEDYAFLYCFSVVYLKLPSTITFMTGHAFSGFFDIPSDVDRVIEVPHGLKEKYLNMFSSEYKYTAKRWIKEEEDNLASIKANEYDHKELVIVSDDDLAHAVTDECGVLYSEDGRRLLKFASETNVDSYYVKKGTEVICSDSTDHYIRTLHIPSSVKYIGKDCLSSVYNIVFQGEMVEFEKDFASLTEYNTIYIPVGTWADYYYKMEDARLKEDDEDEDDYTYSYWEKDRYRLVELSKSNVIRNLEQQKDLLVKAITQTKPFGAYHIDTLNGDKHRGFYVFRTSDRMFFFDEFFGTSMIWSCYTTRYLEVLGYTDKDLQKVLGVQIDEIENNRKNLESKLGFTLAARIFYKWKEDFVDEDTGDVVTVDRCEIIIEAGTVIEEKNIQDIIDSKMEKVKIFHKDYYSNYIELFKSFPAPEENWWTHLYPDEEDKEVVYRKAIQDLFPSKKYEDVTEQDKTYLAYNILLMQKKAIDCSGYLDENMVPLKMSSADKHEISQKEERLSILISDFYNQKILNIKDCDIDLDVMKAFQDPIELQKDLKVFLDSNGMLQDYLKLGVDMIYRYFDEDYND